MPGGAAKKKMERTHPYTQEKTEDSRIGTKKEAQNLQLNLKSFQKVKENKNRIHSKEKPHRQCIDCPVTWRV